MIDRNDLLKNSDFPNVYQAEKDYLQHLVLSRVYSNSSEDLIFKGGTALQKVYGLNRFSEDLDFTLKKSNFEEQITKIERGLSTIKRFYDFSYKSKNDHRSVGFNLKINGPLFKTPASVQTIIMEISLREEVLDKANSMLITPAYPDLSPYFVKVMSLDEILAEKVRALITRGRLRPRDLYDIYFILHKGGRFDIKKINKKLAYYDLEFSNSYFLKRVGEMKGTLWNKELSLLMKDVPDYNTIANYVTEKIISNGLK
jgi:predicted nucleotidyltransferase component of viral defense system